MEFRYYIFKYREMLGLGQNGAGATCQQYWKEMKLAYKCLLISGLILGLFGVFTGLFAYIFANLIPYTVNKLQIWRLFTSFLVDQSIINVIFNLYIMSMCVPIIEQQYSTVYTILEIFLQTLLCNLVFIAYGQIFSFLGMMDVTRMVSYGLIQLMFIFLWQKAAMNPEELTRFCFFPCLMPMKYLPWCFFALLLLFGVRVDTIIACLAGFCQHMVLKRSIIRVPMSFYHKLQSWLPQSAKQSVGFVAIRSVQANLRSVSRDAAVSSPFSRNAPQANEAVNDRVEVIGKGVSIGSSSPVNPSVDFKRHWLKEQPEQNTHQGLIQEKQEKQQDVKTDESNRNMLNQNNQTMMKLHSDEQEAKQQPQEDDE